MVQSDIKSRILNKIKYVISKAVFTPAFVRMLFSIIKLFLSLRYHELDFSWQSRVGLRWIVKIDNSNFARFAFIDDLNASKIICRKIDVLNVELFFDFLFLGILFFSQAIFMFLLLDLHGYRLFFFFGFGYLLDNYGLGLNWA